MNKYAGLSKHLSRAVQNRQTKSLFFAMFFTIIDVHGENIVEFDKEDYTNGIAPFVEPNLDGTPIQIEGFNEHILKLPTMKPSKVIKNSDLNKRPFGQRIDDAVAKNARARGLVNKSVENNEDRIDVRLETMRADVLFNGSLTITGKGYDSIITFPRKASHTIDLGAGNYWDEPGQDAKGDITTFLALLGQSGRTGTHIVGDQISAAALVDIVKEETDFRRVEDGNLRFESLLNVNGAVFYGKFRTLEIWGYDGTFTDENGASASAVPAKKMVVLSAVNNNEMSFGYAGDVEIELDIADAFEISSRNVVTKLIGTRSSVEVESVLTAAPLLKDGDSTIVITVLS